MNDEGKLVLIVGVLLAAGLAASLAAGRLRMPGLVLVLALGMAIGTDGLDLIDFRDFELARQIGVVALAFILFEGGLSAGFDEIRPVLRTSILLATLGTLGTAALTAFVAELLFPELEPLEALLLGSTVAATDAAAVFAVLRGSTLRRRLARTLEGESGINDPIAILLVIGCIEALEDSTWGLDDALLLVVEELAIGFAVGLAVAALAVLFLRRITLPSAGLYPVASVATGALAFGAADTLHGSGFLAVFLAGLVLGTASTPARRTIVTFHEGLAWVAQLGLFLTLGLLVFPSEVIEFAWQGTLVAIATAALARPAAAVIVTVAQGFTLPERLMLGWAGLRGATPIVFATFPVTAGLEDGQLIFNVAFFVVLVSTVLQGTTIEPVARLFGVTSGEAAIPVPLVEPVLLSRLGAEVVQFPVRTRARRRGAPGARARPAAGGAAQRDRARRPRDPAARVDDHPGRRPAAPDRAPGGRRRVPRAAQALAHRPARGAQAPAPARAQPAGGHQRAAVGGRGRRRFAAGRGRRDRGCRSAAHAPRRAGSVGGAGRRALRRHGAAAGGRAGRRAPGRRAAAPGARGVAGRARVVAGGRGGLGAVAGRAFGNRAR